LEVAHSGISLAWPPPQKTLTGSVPVIADYRIYRGESGASAGGSSVNSASVFAPDEAARLKSPLLKIGESEFPSFQDTQFEFGKTYVYSVRSVARYGDARVESADSKLVEVTPRDVFPPAAPQGLVAVMVPAQDDVPAHIELSWAVNPETDIAGYNVYRSEQANFSGTRLNTELLLAPSFRDMNTVPGRHYLYTITAVDRAGNESPASASVSGGVPAESQATP
jgi:predicted phage tail protein